MDRAALLARLFQIHTASLPMYLASAKPWVPPGYERAAETLDAIAADQIRTIGLLTEELLEIGGDLTPGEFPMTFTDLHDLALDYLLGPLVEEQRRDVAAIADCVQQLGGDPLAQEALGAARGHLESLEELAAEPAAV